MAFKFRQPNFVKRPTFSSGFRAVLRCIWIRLRTHNQKMTVAARAIAERKTVGDLS